MPSLEWEPLRSVGAFLLSGVWKLLGLDPVYGGCRPSISCKSASKSNASVPRPCIWEGPPADGALLHGALDSTFPATPLSFLHTPPPAPAPERQQEGEAGLFNWRDSVWQEVRSVPGPERWQLLPSFWDQVSLGFS